MTPTQIRAALDRRSIDADAAFSILRSISAMLASDSESPLAQSLLIRCLEHRSAFAGVGSLLNALLRETGLYPYAEPEALSFRDLLALEFHRPDGSLGQDGVVFHRVQAQVYRDLMAGENVILSAPTSFGKSLIIDAMIASGRYRRIVLVVPTIALIDETRKRISRFSTAYKVVTHSSQTPADDGRGTIFVLTQERVIDRDDLDEIDFFVVDEFYKLDPSGDPDRAGILNHAFYKLLKASKQFYLLGPNIRTVPLDFRERFSAKLIVSDYVTVASDVVRVDTSGGHPEALVRLARTLAEPTLIYCQSPASVRRVAELLIKHGVGAPRPEVQGIVQWVGAHFHPEWVVARALARGIGVHHGRMPRALAQLNVRSFNDGLLNFLICTSTLIEGVNTAARHVVIYDNKVAKTKFDYFTFRNIQGRSGRMFRHFVGTVHLFHEPPQAGLLDVDFPAFSQGENASDALLVQLDAGDLRGDAERRIDRLKDQSDLSFETIRTNRHVDPTAQIALARHIARNARSLYPTLAWRGEPSSDQLYAVCELLFDTLLAGVNREAVRSGKQLAFLLSQLRQLGSAPAFIRARARADDGRQSADDRVENALDFLRTWASFQFPRALVALERIQEEVLSRIGLRPGSYASFAVRIENLMSPAAFTALDEYGLPLQIVERIAGRLRAAEGFDAVLDDLRRLDASSLGLSAFEARLVRDVQSTL